MKSNTEIMDIIRQKVGEHKVEVVGSENMTLELKKEIAKLKKGNRFKDFEKTAKLGILKDKVIFHKACIATLIDLLDEIR